MFFIMGITTRRTPRSSGVFHCPDEGVDRPYRRTRARRWFTVFFVPLIPLGAHGESVSCQACGARYSVDVLRRHAARRVG